VDGCNGEVAIDGGGKSEPAPHRHPKIEQHHNHMEHHGQCRMLALHTGLYRPRSSTN
jgi:hypothetical protein